ncbi:MAG: glycosyltransferase [Bacteroidales bacterium]|jgi:glycosyltransferase involved in cell wall biosynthesis|nr:glycosyltransferase [Bacteroidales bacterium]
MEEGKQGLKVAIVHDWLTQMGGAEKVLRSILDLYPDADIFSIVATEDIKKKLGIEHVAESFICHLPFGRSKYRNYLQLFPLAIEGFDLSKYDIVISCSSSVAKGVLTHSNQLHICYCHTPARYVWDLTWQYLKEKKLTSRWNPLTLYVRRVLHKFRIWDVISSNRVGHFVANSKNVARRINRVYRRDATVIYPPVYTHLFVKSTEEKEDFYLTASRMVPYKKIDLIASAFSKMPDKKLVVIGTGPEDGNIRKVAGKNVEFLGYVPNDKLNEYMQKAKAFVFAADEDFGIVPLEAQACGTPVIAYGHGGCLETIKDGETGVLFWKQDEQSIIDAVKTFEAEGANKKYTADACREWAETFSNERFKTEFSNFVKEKWTEFQEGQKL